MDDPRPSDRPRPGRRRIWCSTPCRRAAHAERVAAERAGIAVRVIEVQRRSPAVMQPVFVPRPPTVADIEKTTTRDNLGADRTRVRISRRANYPLRADFLRRADRI